MCVFSLSFSFGGNVPADEYSGLDRLLRAVPRLVKALIHTPSAAKHPYIEEGPQPGLVLQLYFFELDLEAGLSRDGNLCALNSRSEFPVTSAEMTEQAMVVRIFGVPQPNFRNGETCCSYLVSYEGEADI